MTKELDFLVRVVKEAAGFITDKFTIKSKTVDGRDGLVTDLDTKIEQHFTDAATKEYPDFVVIGEELNSKTELTKNCFVIDPIDGTVNFCHGLPIWGIQVACIKGGKTVAAVIYLPKLDEFYTADKDGAFMNGKPIKVNKLPISQSLYVVEGAGDTRMHAVLRMRKYVRHTRGLACCAAHFAWVACGRFGGTIFRNNNPWDYIPGLYIAAQAGAYIIDKPLMHVAANTQEFAELLAREANLRSDDFDED